MKTYLCICNNCDRILIDENPQVDALEVDIRNMKVHSMEWIEDDGGFWACPHCKTDGYLSDWPAGTDAEDDNFLNKYFDGSNKKLWAWMQEQIN